MDCARTEYFIYSSVLQKKVVEIGLTEAIAFNSQRETKEVRVKLNIIANGDDIAERKILCNGGCTSNDSYNSTKITVADPSGVFHRVIAGDSRTLEAELDPFGGLVGQDSPYVRTELPQYDEDCYFNGGDPIDEPTGWACDDSYLEDEDAGYGSVPENDCYVDGFEGDCNLAHERVNRGEAVVQPGPDMIRLPSFFGEKQVWAEFNAYADGYAGYLPINANYIGDGEITPISTGDSNLDSTFLGTPLTYEMLYLATMNGLETSSPKVFAEVAEFGKVLGYWGEDYYWDRVASSRNPGKNRRERIDDNSLNDWEKYLNEALKLKDCKAFIDKYVGGENLSKVFELVRKQGGFAFNPNINPAYAGETFGSVVKSKPGHGGQGASIDFNPSKRGNTAATIMLLIHELIHASNSQRNDQYMADQLESSGVKLIIPPENRKVNPKYTASINWGMELKKACNITPEMISQWSR